MNRRYSIANCLLLTLFSASAYSQGTPLDPFQTGVFVDFFQRICSNAPIECVPSPPSFPFPSPPGERFSDDVIGLPGEVTTTIPGRASATIGYRGAALTPAISTYIFTGSQNGDPNLSQRITGTHWGIQRYTLTQDNPTLNGTFTYSQSGGTLGLSDPQVGDNLSFGAFRDVGFFAFQTDSGIIDPTQCSRGQDSRRVLACILTSEYDPNTQIETFALQGFSIDPPDVLVDPVVAGSVNATFQISGNAGDTFFVGTYIGLQLARHGGFADSRSTVELEFDDDSAVIPTFTQETFRPTPRLIDIDIKPRKDQNKINPASRGKIKVAILGSQDFDALQTNTRTVRFGPEGAKAIRSSKKVRDTNHDGFQDLVLKFKISKTGIQCGEAESELTGETHLGDSFVAIDFIQTTRCQ